MNKKVDFPQGTLPLSVDLLDTVKSFESKELYWLSGYCSGLADAKQSTTNADSVVKPLPQALQQPNIALKTIILYASQTGNAENIATSLHKKLGEKGIKAELASLSDFKNNQLKKQQIVLMVASTHGEGEPPDDAIEFHEFIRSKRAPKLDGVKHAVLGLGDSSYEFFCQTGKDFDSAFSHLGSKALVTRVDCDLDYEETSEGWILSLLEKLDHLSTANETSGRIGTAPIITTQSLTESIYSKENPFSAVVLENQKITGQGSVKSINHIELSLEGSDLVYQPGDSLGVWPTNDKSVVKELLNLSRLKGDETVEIKGRSFSLIDALSSHLEISLINKRLVEKYADLSQSEPIKSILSNYSEYTKIHQIVDIFKLSPQKLAAQELVELLKPIKPRMYSIASSLQANPEEVHLTVALEISQNENGIRFGSASHYLIDSIEVGDEVKVFVEPNRHFKLPSADKPVVMIGPGTGIAPFRAFLQEREESEASGDNWLIFGNPHFNTDFLYQLEIQSYLKSGLLNELSLAFSRDQQEKIYVQDRILERAELLWQWIDEKQACIYVCGDMSRMAKDVQEALIKVISEQGNMNTQEAEDFLKQLRKDNRYQRDVY